MVNVDVGVEHFVDAGEQDAQGQYDYYYEYDDYTFERGAEKLKVRIYCDEPATALHRGLSPRQARTSELAPEVHRYLASRGVSTFKGIGPSGGYQPFTLDS
jgi:hypothetical protein